MAMNDDEFEAAVAKIQQEVLSDVRRAFGDVGFERWRKTRYHGRMNDADSFARIRGRCGDTMEIYLKFRDGVVQESHLFHRRLRIERAVRIFYGRAGHGQES